MSPYLRLIDGLRARMHLICVVTRHSKYWDMARIESASRIDSADFAPRA